MKGIKKFVDNKINIRDIELLFIFDKNHQQLLKMKNESLSLYGSKYCLNNKINFYFIYLFYFIKSINENSISYLISILS